MYEEKMIDGILHCRNEPNGEWHYVSARDMTNKIVALEAENAKLRQVIQDALKIEDLWCPGEQWSLEHEGEAVALHKMYRQFSESAI